MAEGIQDAKVIQNPEKTDSKDTREVSAESAAVAAIKARPSDLGLIRSLSKSDSDLLASPPGEEDGGGLAGRSGSVSNCSSGQPSMERMPSFASEWDEIEKIMNLIGAGIETSRKKQPTPSSDGACGKALDQSVGEWLEHVGLPQYESKFLLNGFDDLRFMVSHLQHVSSGVTSTLHHPVSACVNPVAFVFFCHCSLLSPSCLSLSGSTHPLPLFFSLSHLPLHSLPLLFITPLHLCAVHGPPLDLWPHAEPLKNTGCHLWQDE